MTLTTNICNFPCEIIKGDNKHLTAVFTGATDKYISALTVIRPLVEILQNKFTETNSVRSEIVNIAKKCDSTEYYESVISEIHDVLAIYDAFYRHTGYVRITNYITDESTSSYEACLYLPEISLETIIALTQLHSFSQIFKLYTIFPSVQYISHSEQIPLECNGQHLSFADTSNVMGRISWPLPQTQDEKNNSNAREDILKRYLPSGFFLLNTRSSQIIFEFGNNNVTLGELWQSLYDIYKKTDKKDFEKIEIEFRI